MSPSDGISVIYCFFKYSPFLHEILDSPYLPPVLILDRIVLCCCVGALLVGLNQFNTGRLTQLTRRAIL